jgi:hypothetical protein
MITPLKSLVRLLKNPDTPTLLSLITFVGCFFLAPYNSISSVLSLLVGLAILYVWTHMLIMHSMRSDFLTKKTNIELQIQRLKQKNGPIIENIKSRAQRLLADLNSDSSTQDTYSKVSELFTNNNITNLEHITPYIESLDTRYASLNTIHKICAGVGLLSMMGGAALEIFGNINSMDSSSTDSTCSTATPMGTNVVATTAPPTSGFPFLKAGSAVLTTGFALSGLAHFFLNIITKGQHEKLELILKALAEEESYPEQASPIILREESLSSDNLGAGEVLPTSEPAILELPSQSSIGSPTALEQQVKPIDNPQRKSSPLKFIVNVLINPSTPELLSLTTFFACFYLAPYNSVSSTVSLLFGLAIWHGWTHMLYMHTLRGEFLNTKTNIELHVRRLKQKSAPALSQARTDAVINIKSRAESTLADSNSDDITQAKYRNIIELLTENNINELDSIMPFLEYLDRCNVRLHRIHKGIAGVGLVFMMGGASIEIYADVGIHGNSATNSTCVTTITPMPTNTSTTSAPSSSNFSYLKLGSGLLSSAFAIAALTFFVIYIKIKSHKENLELILKALAEEESHPDPNRRSPPKARPQPSDAVALGAMLSRSGNLFPRPESPISAVASDTPLNVQSGGPQELAVMERIDYRPDQ